MKYIYYILKSTMIVYSVLMYIVYGAYNKEMTKLQNGFFMFSWNLMYLICYFIPS